PDRSSDPAAPATVRTRVLVRDHSGSSRGTPSSSAGPGEMNGYTGASCPSMRSPQVVPCERQLIFPTCAEGTTLTSWRPAGIGVGSSTTDTATASLKTRIGLDGSGRLVRGDSRSCQPISVGACVPFGRPAASSQDRPADRSFLRNEPNLLRSFTMRPVRCRSSGHFCGTNPISTISSQGMPVERSLLRAEPNPHLSARLWDCQTLPIPVKRSGARL
ncbi:MAG: hypothetical protein JWO38_2744, partial [Gemmataceae bacterium]|nr:hypothetical protein [Gemmataceae bacterium]